MTKISKWLRSCALACLPIILSTPAIGQGYYYPYPNGYYPQYQQPGQPQRRAKKRPQQHRHNQAVDQTDQDYPPEQPAKLRKSAKSVKDLSADTPPVSDMSATTGPLVAYTWNYTDTLSDLAKACGLTANQVLSLNNLALSQLRDGQVLRVPPINKLDAATKLDIQPQPDRQTAREVWRGIRGKNRVALTYDAGGEPDGLETLLNNLTDHKAPATFFVTGKFGEDHPELVKKIFAGGFPVHNHSWSHPEFTTLSEDVIARELARTDDIITSITGQSTKPFWRPPFGDRDARVLNAAARNGYRSIYWTLDTLDSVDNKKDSDFIVNRIFSPPRAKANPLHYLDGAIILMHVGETGTADAAPAIIDGLRERGFTLVTVEEILKP